MHNYSETTEFECCVMFEKIYNRSYVFFFCTILPEFLRSCSSSFVALKKMALVYNNRVGLGSPVSYVCFTAVLSAKVYMACQERHTLAHTHTLEGSLSTENNELGKID